ncbi:MAG: hypothetical protein ACMUEM_04290 [Flavobacteriales bacterium AspAUS03]
MSYKFFQLSFKPAENPRPFLKKLRAHLYSRSTTQDMLENISPEATSQQPITWMSLLRCVENICTLPRATSLIHAPSSLLNPSFILINKNS